MCSYITCSVIRGEGPRRRWEDNIRSSGKREREVENRRIDESEKSWEK
jgi:hypothetical protein